MSQKRASIAPIKSQRPEKRARASTEPPAVAPEHAQENVRPDFPSPLLKPVVASQLTTLLRDGRVLYDLKNEFFREPQFPTPWPEPPPREGEWKFMDKLRYITMIDYYENQAIGPEQYGLLWEVYNIDEKNVQDICVLVPDDNKFMKSREKYGDDRDRDIYSVKTAAFHLGRVSWTVKEYQEAFPVGFLPQVMIDIVIDYMGRGTDRPIVSVRRDHIKMLTETNHLPQQVWPVNFTKQRIVVDNACSLALITALKSVLCSGRKPLGKHGRLTPAEIPVVASPAMLDHFLKRTL